MNNKGENTETCDVTASLTNERVGNNQQGLKLSCKMNREPMDSSEDVLMLFYFQFHHFAAAFWTNCKQVNDKLIIMPFPGQWPSDVWQDNDC